MTTPKPTVQGLKQWAIEAAPLASAVLAARVFAEATRARVDAYTQAILDEFPPFPPDPRWAGEVADRCRPDGGIQRPADLYLADVPQDDPVLQAFYRACDRAHRAHAFTGPDGHCPALHAEALRRTAEKALLESAGALFGWTYDQLCRSYGAIP